MGIKMVFYTMYAAWKFAEREGRKPPHQYIQTWLEAIDLCVCNWTEILDLFRKARNKRRYFMGTSRPFNERNGFFSLKGCLGVLAVTHDAFLVIWFGSKQPTSPARSPKAINQSFL